MHPLLLSLAVGLLPALASAAVPKGQCVMFTPANSSNTCNVYGVAANPLAGYASTITGFGLCRSGCVTDSACVSFTYDNSKNCTFYHVPASTLQPQRRRGGPVIFADSACFFIGPPVQAVQNGGFESGSIAPWTNQFQTAAMTSPDGTGEDSNYALALQISGTTTTGVIQTVQLCAGHNYTLSFAVYPVAITGDSPEFEVLVRGNQNGPPPLYLRAPCSAEGCDVSRGYVQEPGDPMLSVGQWTDLKYDFLASNDKGRGYYSPEYTVSIDSLTLNSDSITVYFDNVQITPID